MSLALVARCRGCNAVAGAAVFDGVDSQGWALDALAFLAEGYAVTMEELASFQQEACRCIPAPPEAGPPITWDTPEDDPGRAARRLCLSMER